MSINIGNNPLKKLYIGDTLIKYVYIGSNKLWSSDCVVTWRDYQGNELATEVYSFGATPKYKGSAPSGTTGYKFSNIQPVTADITYRAAKLRLSAPTNVQISSSGYVSWNAHPLTKSYWYKINGGEPISASKNLSVVQINSGDSIQVRAKSTNSLYDHSAWTTPVTSSTVATTSVRFEWAGHTPDSYGYYINNWIQVTYTFDGTTNTVERTGMQTSGYSTVTLPVGATLNTIRTIGGNGKVSTGCIIGTTSYGSVNYVTETTGSMIDITNINYKITGATTVKINLSRG